MKQQTVLTPEQRKQIQGSMHPWDRISDFGLAIEQAVLQSPEVQGLMIALKSIEEWDPPYVLSKGEPVPMSVAIGSNGERDYFRSIARAALTAMEKQP